MSDTIIAAFLCAGGNQASTTTAGAFVPVERELVFDIDLTDYDDVRTCGKEGHICTKCWPLMAIAVQVCILHFQLLKGDRAQEGSLTMT